VPERVSTATRCSTNTTAHAEIIMENSVFQARWLLIPIAGLALGFVLLGTAAA
jgi:uncharacterized membrane protein YqhA